MINGIKAEYEICSKCPFFKQRNSKIIDGVFAKCSVNGVKIKNILTFRSGVCKSKNIPEKCMFYFEYLMNVESRKQNL